VLTQTSAPPLLCEPAIAEECKAACVPTPATKITKWGAQPPVGAQCQLDRRLRLLGPKYQKAERPQKIHVQCHVRELMADRAQWAGSASYLLQAGINIGGNAMAAWTRSGWPKSPRALAGRLRRAQPLLRTLGIEIVFGREGRLGTRTIRITAMGENRTHDTVSTVSRVSNYGDRAGLNHPKIADYHAGARFPATGCRLVSATRIARCRTRVARSHAATVDV
jgi:hypothetical protein